MDPVKFGKDGKVKLPQPDEITKKEKEDAMGAYLMMFASMAIGLPLPIINLLASFIYYLLNNKKSRFVAFHAHQSLVTQFFVSFLNAGLVSWAVVNIVKYFKYNKNFFNEYFVIVLLIVIIWNIIYIVYSIIACVKAYKGKFFYMLFFGRISFNKFYKKNFNIKEKKELNLPPSGF